MAEQLYVNHDVTNTFLSPQAVWGTDSFPKLHFYLLISVCSIPAGGGCDPA